MFDREYQYAVPWKPLGGISAGKEEAGGTWSEGASALQVAGAPFHQGRYQHIQRGAQVKRLQRSCSSGILCCSALFVALPASPTLQLPNP